MRYRWLRIRWGGWWTAPYPGPRRMELLARFDRLIRGGE